MIESIMSGACDVAMLFGTIFILTATGIIITLMLDSDEKEGMKNDE